jgi:hypothetical protein
VCYLKGRSLGLSSYAGNLFTQDFEALSFSPSTRSFLPFPTMSTESQVVFSMFDKSRLCNSQTPFHKTLVLRTGFISYIDDNIPTDTVDCSRIRQPHYANSQGSTAMRHRVDGRRLSIFASALQTADYHLLRYLAILFVIVALVSVQTITPRMPRNTKEYEEFAMDVPFSLFPLRFAPLCFSEKYRGPIFCRLLLS